MQGAYSLVNNSEATSPSLTPCTTSIQMAAVVVAGEEQEERELEQTHQGSKGAGMNQTGAVIAMTSTLIASFFSTYIAYPIAPFMTRWFFPKLPESKLGFYTGYLDSAYFFGPLFFSLPFTKLSDNYGRKLITEIAMVGTALSSAVFGLSVNFPMALAMRFVWGTLDASVAVIKTAMGDLANNPHFTIMPQSRLFGLIGIGAGIGRTFGSFVGGWLGAVYGGGSTRKCSAWTQIFCDFPYLLPCLAPTVIISVALLLIVVFFEETSPTALAKHHRRMVIAGESGPSYSVIQDDPKEMETKHDPKESEDAEESAPMETATEEKKEENEKEEDQASSKVNVWEEVDTLKAIGMYSILCIYSSGTNAIVPVWLLQSNHGVGHGFNMQEHEIGTVWALVGPPYLLNQLFGYHHICHWLGFVNTAKLSFVMSGILVFIMPFLSTDALMGGFDENHLSSARQWTNVLVVGFVLAMQTLFNVMALSTCVVFVNNASLNAAKMRATANGISQSMGSLGRLVGPLIFCNLFSGVITLDESWQEAGFDYRFPFYVLTALVLFCALFLHYGFPDDFEERLHKKEGVPASTSSSSSSSSKSNIDVKSSSNE